MKKSTLALFACFLLFIPITANAAELNDQQDLERYNLLMSYVAFGAMWKDRICTQTTDSNPENQELNNTLHTYLGNTQLCEKLKKIDELTIKMNNGGKFYDKIEIDDYLLMSYSSLIITWPFAIFYNTDTFNTDELIILSIKYFYITDANNIKMYRDMVSDDTIYAQAFFDLVEPYNSIYGFHFQKYIESSSLFQDWIEMHRQTYKFFNTRVGE